MVLRRFISHIPGRALPGIRPDGKKFEFNGIPSEIIDKLTDKDGNIRDEFVAFGGYYINSKQIIMLYSDELEKR